MRSEISLGWCDMLFFKKKKTLEEAVKPISTHALGTLPYAEEMQVVHNDVNTDDAWNRIRIVLENAKGVKNCIEIDAELYESIPYDELISTLEFMGYKVESSLGYEFIREYYNNGYLLRIAW